MATAARDHQRLRVDYVRHDGARSRREIEPHRVVHVGHRWLLVARDLAREDWRTFRLDRLVPSAPSGPRFAPCAVPDDLLRRWVTKGDHGRPYPFRCRISVRGSAAAVGERVITTTRGQVRALDASSCEVVGGSVSLEDGQVGRPARLRGHRP